VLTTRLGRDLVARRSGHGQPGRVPLELGGAIPLRPELRSGRTAALRALTTALLMLLACALAASPAQTASPAQAAGTTTTGTGPEAVIATARTQTPTTSSTVNSPAGTVTTPGPAWVTIVPVPAASPSPGAEASTGAAGAAAASTGADAGSDTAEPGRRPLAATCSVRVAGGQVPAVKPGDTVCFAGPLRERLSITHGGTASAPVTYSGLGTATVPGITARGENIVLEGFVSRGAKDNGFYVSRKPTATRTPTACRPTRTPNPRARTSRSRATTARARSSASA
jgi:hypothetical protein